MEEDVGSWWGTGVRRGQRRKGRGTEKKRVEAGSERQSMDGSKTRQGSENKKKGRSKGESEIRKNRSKIGEQAEDRQMIPPLSLSRQSWRARGENRVLSNMGLCVCWGQIPVCMETFVLCCTSF